MQAITVPQRAGQAFVMKPFRPACGRSFKKTVIACAQLTKTAPVHTDEEIIDLQGGILAIRGEADAQGRPGSNAHSMPLRIAGAILAAAITIGGPAVADETVQEILENDIPKLEEQISGVTDAEQEATVAQELGSLESEATQAEEQQQGGRAVDDAASAIKDQLEALKAAFGLN